MPSLGVRSPCQKQLEILQPMKRLPILLRASGMLENLGDNNILIEQILLHIRAKSGGKRQMPHCPNPSSAVPVTE